jgi:DnaK suppressor protein
MDEKQIENFRQQLLKLRSEILNLSDESEDSAKPVELDQASVGRLSRMDAMRAQSMAVETKGRRENQILRIESALRRIVEGEYGFCLTCGDEMDIRRLEIDPSYTQCIKCADK